MLGLLAYEGDLDELLKNGYTIEETPDEFDYNQAQTNVTLKEGQAGLQVNLMITRLTELGYLTEPKPTYFDSRVLDAVKHFQTVHSLAVDGIAGSNTLTLLYSDAAIPAVDQTEPEPSTPPDVDDNQPDVSIGNVENVDFFSEEGAKYYDRNTGEFKVGATAVITDVATGISFTVRRCGGINHTDVEPLTAADTQRMFEIYGGKWSWNRRAVFVTLSSGTTLAGSMNGMPHGKNTISGNNFDGQFCIHFLNSRTSDSNKVDPEHQAAVQQAATVK